MTAKPFAKWAGGKTALLPEILSHLPEKIGTYYEPFIGGGAVFFALAAGNRFKRAYLSDSNEELIVAYRALAADTEAVISALSKHVHNSKHYYAVRALDPKKLDRWTRAARFIYLNRTCFNGLYRVNSKGVFNVPFGSYSNPTICDAENLRAVGAVLRKTGVAIQVRDFGAAVSEAQRGDAVYFDPPYLPVSETANFTAYSKGGFTEADHERLRDVAKKLVNRGVHVLLSNSDTPFAHRLYAQFRIDEVEAPRRVNSKASKRGNVSELLISGWKR